jgi:hypothetical protein
VFDPPRLRIMLLEFALCQRDNFAIAIENNGPRRSRALIEGHQILSRWHTRQPKRVLRCESPNEKNVRRLLDAVIMQSCTLKAHLLPLSADFQSIV